MTAQKRTYRYSINEEGNKKYVDVEVAGRVTLNEGESAEDRARGLIVSTQQVPEESVELEKVDNVQDAVVTSDTTPKKNARRK